MLKIAICGGTGLLGSNLVKQYLKQGFLVKAFSRSHSNNIDKKTNKVVNFLDIDTMLEKELSKFKPNIIINAIALVNLKTCEENYTLAYNTNVFIAKKLALIAKKQNSYFVHISTDHFFNDKLMKHTETDETILLNNYAKTKYEAENEVLKIYPQALVVRTNIIGFRNNKIDSFFEWLINSLQNNSKVSLYSNFYTSPIAITLLSNLLIQCFEHRFHGIYNISSSTVIDKYNFGIKVANKFNFSTGNINKATIKTDITDEVQRALTLGLDVSKIENNLNVKMPTVDETIENLYLEYMENK